MKSSSRLSGKVSKQDFKMAATTTVDNMNNKSSTLIKNSTTNHQPGTDCIRGGTRYETAKNGGIITRACSRCEADIRAKKSTLAASAAASVNSINHSVAPRKVDVGNGPVDMIIDTAQEKASNITSKAGTSININGKKKAAAGDDAQYNHENGAKMQPGEEKCCFNSAVMGEGWRSCRNETKYVKKVQAKAADVYKGQAAVATESRRTRRCSQRISKLRPALTAPPHETYTSKCDDEHVKMITKSSYNDHGNNSNDGAVLHGWLQGMRETSPPRTTSPTATVSSSPFHMNAHIEAATTNEDLELIHRAWMVKHPSALDKLEEIAEAASGKRVAVFLDYDGTLSPIVEDPDRAFMSHQMRAIVKEVANVFPTAIISGRCKEKLHEFVQLPELYYAGSHGMEIIGPARPHNLEDAQPPHTKGNVVLFQPAKEFTYIIDKVYKVLVEKTKGVPGARVEHNKFCVSVHFRCVKERHWMALAEQVHQVLQSYPNVRLTQGRKVLEIRPLIAWNKGKALDFLLKALGLNDQNSVFPIYLGDDRSDEDAFKVLNRRKHGLGILVTTAAKETNAVCSLRDPSEVHKISFVKKIVGLYQESTSSCKLAHKN